MQLQSIRGQQGFTLVEIMIVIAIIGILTTIAAPNFLKFQARTRQAEAKSNLMAIFVATKAQQVERGAAACTFCGWGPDGKNLYSYYASDGTTTEAKPALMAGGATGGAEASCAGTGWAAAQKSATGAFTATAVGNLDGDPTVDCWVVNDSRELTNPQNDTAL